MSGETELVRIKYVAAFMVATHYGLEFSKYVNVKMKQNKQV